MIKKKRIAVLGATGSIGKQTLEVIAASPDLFEVYCMSCDNNTALLASLANKFCPAYIGIRNEKAINSFRELLSYSPEIITGEFAACELAKLPEVDIVVNAVSGIAGLMPLISAIENGKIIAAANKESIVCGHSLLEGYKKTKNAPLTDTLNTGARIIPVDSEQSAIFQCLDGKKDASGLILTASGGAFYDTPVEQLRTVTVQQALKHPIWSMGKKITVDSATLFNKGLEVMEAAYLFGFSGESIQVVIHRQSIVHSMVSFSDNAVIAQMGVPDMRLAIQFALTYPQRVASPAHELDFTRLSLTFEKPDFNRFPALSLAYHALSEGDILPIVYNSANEKAVEIFFAEKIPFDKIPNCVEYAMSKTYTCHASCINDIMEVEKSARRFAEDFLHERNIK